MWPSSSLRPHETAESCATQLKPPYFHRKCYDLMSVTKQWYRLLYDLEMPLVGQETTNITRFCLIVGKAGNLSRILMENEQVVIR